MQLQALVLAVGNMKRTPLSLVILEKLGVVVGLALDALPCIQGVVSGTQAAQAETSRLVADGFAEMISASSQALLWHGHDDRVGKRLALAVDGNSFGRSAIRARDYSRAPRCRH